MTKGGKTKECIFHSGDYHFEMIVLPYVSKHINEGKKVIVFTQSNLEETIEVLLNRVNFKKEDKNKILEINWNDSDKSKIDELKLVENKEVVIYVKGNVSYINNINSQIEEITKTKNLELSIIDCYEFEETKDKMQEIKDKYTNNVKTIKI